MMIQNRATNRYKWQDTISGTHHHWKGLLSLKGFLPECKFLLSRICYALLKINKSQYSFDGRIYSYFHHRYNMTWRSERAVEIPIVRDLMKQYKGSRVLEVGNVLSHYFAGDHDVVDLCEKGPEVVHQDVLDFKPKTPYDLIVSISTLEHIGIDEEPPEPKKALAALDHLNKHCLNPGGLLVVTFPYGHNPSLDQAIKNHHPLFANTRFLKRTSPFNSWREIDLGEISDGPVAPKYPGTNGLVVLKFSKKGG